MIQKLPSLHILVTGASGLVGSSLVPFLKQEGHQVSTLSRKKKDHQTNLSGTIFWNPSEGEVPLKELEGFDAVIHLAGENIAGFWTKQKKERLFLSRCRDTWLLAEGLSRLKEPPKIFIAASAIGFYGSRPGELLGEESAPGTGFLPNLVVDWEKAAAPLRKTDTRIVHTRFGVILSSKGGMVAKMAPSFRLGFGMKMGSGKQLMSWIAIQDVVGGLYHLLMNSEAEGAFNFTTPNPVSQEEFANALAKKLGSRVRLAVPAWLLKALLGDMAKELFLTDQNVSCDKLMRAGYRFQYPALEEALFSIEPFV